jgi:hypothetical protein
MKAIYQFAAIAAVCCTLGTTACSGDSEADSSSPAVDTIAASADDTESVAEGSAAEESFAAETTAVAAGSADTASSQKGADVGSNDTAIGANLPVVRREVIYTADAQVEVDNAAQRATQIRNQVTAAGGFVLNDNRVGGSADLILKVPPAKFDSTMASLDRLGKVVQRSVSASDVTAQMVDLEARLKSAIISRDRIRTFLAAAQKIEDVIVLESELQQRESSVEQLQGQLNVIRNQVGFATVTLRLYERQVAVIDDTKTTPSEALNNGWVALQNLVTGLILIGATLLPFAPLLVVAVLGFRWWLKRRAARPRRTPTAVWTPPTPPTQPIPPAPPTPALVETAASLSRETE